MVEIIPVQSKRQLAAFIDLPHDLYANDPNYVPELFLGQQDLLSANKHPFYKHSSAQAFLAYKEGKLVGRILAICNTNHNTYNNVSQGEFGLFKCIIDKEVAETLLDTAVDWVKPHGCNYMVGPINLTTNDTRG